MEELWKEIPRYPFCEASNKGRIRYKDKIYVHGNALQIRPIKLGGFGYHQVTIKNKTESVHNLVAEAFIGTKPSNLHRADHINGNKLDNRPINLRWLLHSLNTKRSAYTGKRRLFSVEDLSTIKKLISERISYSRIAKQFKCSKSMIWSISAGHKDTHTTDNPFYKNVI